MLNKCMKIFSQVPLIFHFTVTNMEVAKNKAEAIN